MTLHLHDTATGKRSPFHPMEEGHVRMYNCGPTVYNYVHIGNMRSFLLADLLRRTSEWLGFKVTQIMNLTDVGHMTEDDLDPSTKRPAGDRMEIGAKERGLDPWELSRLMTEAFFEDAQTVRLRRAHHYPKATDHIPEMIDLIERLLARGHAYEAPSGVYFDVASFESYGSLSGNTVEDLRAGARIDPHPDKKNPADFALWKKDENHIMQWDSPWGRGFPGWHAECSAMGMKYLGETFDIHTGGEDNIFPHHECEIAQSEGATGKPFVRVWVHARHLLVNGKKMSKSLKNFYTVRDLLNRGYEGRVIRYALLSGHYRQNLNFTLESLDAAQSAIASIDGAWKALRFASDESSDPEWPSRIERVLTDFESALCDDLNISRAQSALFSLVSDIHRHGISSTDAPQVQAALERLDEIFDCRPDQEHELEPPALLKLIERRQQARQDKDWALADELREEALKLGYVLEDTADGKTIWTRNS